MNGVMDITFRAASATDWPAIAAVVNAARQADGADEVRSPESLASEFANVVLERDGLIAEAGDTVVGFGFGYAVERDGSLVGELTGGVHPGSRRRGIGTDLFRRNHARLAAELAADPRPGSRELRAYALDVEAADIALLAAQGFVPVRFGFEMRRYLAGPLPVHELPPGLELRPVTAGTYRTIFDADNEAFEDHWGHRPPTEADFRSRFESPETDTSLWCVAWDGDEVAGVVMNGIFADENEQIGLRRGWLEHVSVRRSWRGRGVAKALCAASFRVLREHGMEEAWLGVDGSNPTGAVRLYEGLGFHVVRGWKAYGRPVDGPAPEGWRSAADRETIGA
jgi:mycothiol synthase